MHAAFFLTGVTESKLTYQPKHTLEESWGSAEWPRYVREQVGKGKEGGEKLLGGKASL